MLQQNDSVTHIHVAVPFQILFPFRLLQNVEQSSLGYTVACWFSILNIAICTCSCQTPNLSHPFCYKTDSQIQRMNLWLPEEKGGFLKCTCCTNIVTSHPNLPASEGTRDAGFPSVLTLRESRYIRMDCHKKCRISSPVPYIHL